MIIRPIAHALLDTVAVLVGVVLVVQEFSGLDDWDVAVLFVDYRVGDAEGLFRDLLHF